MPEQKSLISDAALVPRTRRLHVGYLPNQGKGNPKPQIKLSGDWLAVFGFIPGKAVQLEAQSGRLIITLQEGEGNHSSHPPHVKSPVCNIELLRFGRIIQHPMLMLP
ncbi:Toxin SymE, type I toxin-antitoxin system [Izhakiella capsodis]|uniref:Toxin SymE, type I toxin-antitoxin system n=1 Tax=Izhakiella capsodis TaxID=1367852 RepID=A0A1I4YJH8_9GAMM|nr:SymE family type I addiction module toxin [Izhakiella capsodis]SFN38165.1 Toxin SymE, type I toxin-antitoxin system [Izhakiella capsodis]